VYGNWYNLCVYETKLNNEPHGRTLRGTGMHPRTGVHPRRLFRAACHGQPHLNEGNVEAEAPPGQICTV